MVDKFTKKISRRLRPFWIKNLKSAPPPINEIIIEKKIMGKSTSADKPVSLPENQIPIIGKAMPNKIHQTKKIPKEITCLKVYIQLLFYTSFTLPSFCLLLF